MTLRDLGLLDRIVACTRYCVDVCPEVGDGSRLIVSDSWSAETAQILAARQARAAPVLQRFQEWLLAEAPKMIPKNPLRLAMNYILHNWQAFSRYVQDGRLSIDNNPAERALRGIALGRNNWLFRGSDRGGRAAAIHLSLLASCQRNGLEPFAYLRHVLREIPLLGPSASADELRAFLPDRCPPT